MRKMIVTKTKSIPSHMLTGIQLNHIVIEKKYSTWYLFHFFNWGAGRKVVTN